MEDRGDRYGGLPRPRDDRLKRLRERIEAMLDRFRGTDPETGETDYWGRGGLAGLLGMPAWYEQSPVDIAMGFAGSTTPAVKALSAPTKGIRGYHGSPHDFPAERLIRRPGGSTEYIVGQPDKLPDLPAGVELVRDFPLGRFRDDKIGTGEGAQAFGHGHYLAEAEATGRTYRDNLARPDLNFTRSGKAIPSDLSRMLSDSYDDAIRRSVRHPSEGDIVHLTRQRLDQQTRDALKANDMDWYKWINARKDELAVIEKDLPRSAGRMYEVNINADPARFLDWDKPLHNQPITSDLMNAGIIPKFPDRQWSRAEELNKTIWDQSQGFTKRAQGLQPEFDELYKIIDDIKGQGFSMPIGAAGLPEIPKHAGTGRDLYGNLQEAVASNAGAIPQWAQKLNAAPTASQRLNEAGIPGIKYLDQGSRKAGEGSRNYVVFNPDIIDILRKYGLLPPIVGGAASGLPAPHEASR